MRRLFQTISETQQIIRAAGIRSRNGENMVPSIARQSVMIKCNMQKSVLTGNYEFYYAAGLLSKLYRIVIDDEIRQQELKEQIENEIKHLSPKDEKEAYLLKLLGEYKPEDVYDGQMKELLLMGKSESNLWAVTVPQ